MSALCGLASCNKDDEIEAPTLVICPGDDGGSDATFRPATAVSAPRSNRVYEWTPAPGQFINEASMVDAIEGELTPQAAAQWAQERLAAGQYVSLGGFGGYIVVGFDHSIVNSGGYDFAVAGNAFFYGNTTVGGSSEPGIVYVSADDNGNGLPDDTWYELAGSEAGKATTLRQYAVTYNRPAEAASAVTWTDNYGQSGTIDYVPIFHTQECYYPLWVEADSYTLSGTRLESHTSQDEDGIWHNYALDWGYADNMGQDNVALASLGSQSNRFRIADAVDADGNSVALPFIDFVKVQTGVNAKAPSLGELSTEVFGFLDLAL